MTVLLKARTEMAGGRRLLCAGKGVTSFLMSIDGCTYESSVRVLCWGFNDDPMKQVRDLNASTPCLCGLPKRVGVTNYCCTTGTDCVKSLQTNLLACRYQPASRLTQQSTRLVYYKNTTSCMGTYPTLRNTG